MGGNSSSISKKYWGSSDFHEKDINYGAIINTLHVSEQGERIPIGISPNIKTNLEEFQVIQKPGGYIDILKIRYNAPDELCCLRDERYGWEINGSVDQVPALNKQLFTCHPGTSRMGYSNICDDILYKYCVINPNSQSIYKCKVWMTGLLERYNIDKVYIDGMNNAMFEKCKNNKNNLMCKEWLTALRTFKEEVYQSIADRTLENQLDKSDLKCAFPPDYLQNNTANPVECWYKECALSPTWKLLTKNINNKSLCTINNCIIKINNLNISKDTIINAKCNQNDILESSKVISDKIQELGNPNIIAIPSYFHIFSLFMITIIFCIIK